MPRRKEAAFARPCTGCGRDFRLWKIDGRYCSGKCRQAARRARLRVPILVPEPDTHDLAWAAGFFDGEGCFTATASNYYETSEGRQCRRYLRLSVWQKHEPLLLQLQVALGVGRIYVQKQRPTSSAGFTWVCNGREAFHVANALWPWLGEQKKADFKRALLSVRKTRQNFVRQPQRGRRVVLRGGGRNGEVSP